MTNEKSGNSNSYIYSVIIEASIVFLILSLFLLIEFHLRNLLTVSVIKEITKTTLLLSISYIFVYRIFKSGYYVFFKFITSVVPQRVKNSGSLYDYLVDAFFSLALILTTAPVRPILQKVYFEENKPIFDQALVKFDALTSSLILSVLAIPLMILIIIKHKGLARNFYIFGMIFLILIVGFLNNKPNYDARIYESRADWITRNWERQGTDAQKALKDAETDSEKAVAYYWLGVSENRKGNTEKAIEYQLKAIEHDPNYGAPFSSLSLSYLHLGDLEKARINAEKCVELDPDYAWCYYALSGYYEYSNEKQDAYEHLKKALQLDPNAEDLQNTYEEFIKNNPQFIE